MKLKIALADAEADVDDDRADLIGYRWRLDRDGYVYRKTAGKRLYLHHVIVGPPDPGWVTDHINRDKLDNRSCNLRHIERAVSQQNVGPQRRNAVGIRGVHWDKSAGRFKASVRLSGGRTVSAGYHDDAVSAGMAAKALRAKVLPFSID